MRTLTTLGTALGIALLLHAPGWAQTLGELSAAQGVGSSVSAAGASCSSITSLNLSKGSAPDSMRPLMKKAGVPLTPTLSPSATSLSIAALKGLSLRH